MIATIGSRILAGLGGRAGVIAVSVGLVLFVTLAFTARIMVRTIEAQATKIVELEVALKTEQEQRLSDVTGLTTLVDGLMADNRKEHQDQGAIEHALAKADPNPLSPFMRAYFECLRAHRDGAEDCTSRASDAGEAAGAAGAGPADGN